jgi:protein-tyrosine phosphatase
MTSVGGRHIPLSGTFNMRDVGGYPAAGGRTTRWRTLLRSDTLHRADASGPVLQGYGLRTVIDLRTDAEVDFAPSPSCGPDTRTVRISLIGADVAEVPQRLAAIYEYLIDRRGEVIAGAIGELAAAGSVPALVHCSAGKDRTGIVIGLVLAVLGVPDEVIAADYAVSAGRVDPQVLAALNHVPGASTTGSGGLTPDLLSSPPALLLDVLARARSAGGGTVEGYLTTHGLPPSSLATLRTTLTE